MNLTENPLRDLELDGITFEGSQTGWLEHHIRNALVGLAYGDKRARERSQRRMLDVLAAVREQTRPPYSPRKRCLGCDELRPLVDGPFCASCSDEEA